MSRMTEFDQKVVASCRVSLPGGATIFTVTLCLEAGTGLFSDDYFKDLATEMLVRAASTRGLKPIPLDEVVVKVYAALAAAGSPPPQEERASHCKCGRELIYNGPDDKDPWCPGVPGSAAVCDCIPINQTPPPQASEPL